MGPILKVVYNGVLQWLYKDSELRAHTKGFIGSTSEQRTRQKFTVHGEPGEDGGVLVAKVTTKNNNKNNGNIKIITRKHIKQTTHDDDHDGNDIHDNSRTTTKTTIIIITTTTIQIALTICTKNDNDHSTTHNNNNDKKENEVITNMAAPQDFGRGQHLMDYPGRQLPTSLGSPKDMHLPCYTLHTSYRM